MEIYLALIAFSSIILVFAGIVHLFLVVRIAGELRQLCRSLGEAGGTLRESFDAIARLAENINRKTEQSGEVIVSLQETAEVLLDTAVEAKAVVTPIIRQIGDLGEELTARATGCRPAARGAKDETFPGPGSEANPDGPSPQTCTGRADDLTG